MTSLRKNKHLGPTRLAAAWVILGGCVAGIGIAALMMSPPPDRGAIVIDLAPGPDRYASARTTEIDRPVLPMSEAGETSDRAIIVSEAEIASPPPNSPPLPLSLTSEPIATATNKVVETVPEDEGILTDEVVITVAGKTVDPSSSGRGVAPLPPDPSLMAVTASGTRPAISADGRRPFDAYRRQNARLASAPTNELALMVSGLGLNATLTNRAIAELPPEVTLSFAPYSKNLDQYVARARAKGHEVVIEVPMEQENVEPGALGSAALHRAYGKAANLKRLDWILSRTDAFPMVTNYLGETFSADPGAMDPVLSVIADAGLAYLDDTGAAADAAREAGTPYAFVDAVVPPGTSGVERRILAETANDSATPRMVKVYAASGGLEGVLAFVQSDARRNVTLVPASAKVR